MDPDADGLMVNRRRKPILAARPNFISSVPLSSGRLTGWFHPRCEYTKQKTGSLF